MAKRPTKKAAQSKPVIKDNYINDSGDFGLVIPGAREPVECERCGEVHPPSGRYCQPIYPNQQ